jgi:hypothetical protein
VAAEVTFDQNILSSIRGLTPTVTEGVGLTVDVDEFSYENAGTTVPFAGSAGVAVPANCLCYVYLDIASGTVQVSYSGYPTGSVPLARVESGQTSINTIIVDRASIKVASLYRDVPLYSATAKPDPPIPGRGRLYGRQRHGRAYLDWQSSNGRDYPLQPFLGNNMVVMWLPETSTTIRTWGIPVTSVGTVSTPTIASTSLSTSFRRWRLTSAGTANSASENRAAQNVCWRGNAAGLGGFTLVMRVNLSTIPANSRGFFGLLSATGATSTSQSPQALTNCLGFAWESAETSFRFQNNDGTGTATRVDLGANFPTNSTTAVYTMYIYAFPNGSDVWYRIVREDNGSIAEGSVSTDLPSNTTFLTPHLYMNNGGTASACSFDCGGVYIETDY